MLTCKLNNEDNLLMCISTFVIYFQYFECKSSWYEKYFLDEVE